MSRSPDLAAAARAYADFYEALTPERLPELSELCAPDVRFKDPFNEVRGVAALTLVFAKMFEDVEAPRFRVDDIAIGAERAYLRWRFTFRRKGGGREAVIDGMTEVGFDAQGRVAEHIDHWDAASQLYERVPLLGSLIRLVKRRIAAAP